VRILPLLAAAAMASAQPSAAWAQSGPPPPAPYTGGGGPMLNVNGRMLPRDTVFRFLPVTLPLASIRVTSLYGMRQNPFTHSGSEFHPGVDFGAPVGTPVYSTGAGIVRFAGSMGGYGAMVEVEHGFGFRTRYGHLSAIDVQAGQIVDRNTVLGEVGSTGRSTGPHLYWEIWNRSVNMDPVDFVLRAYEVYHHLK
jgi:murein DD-endopeptidase MepM/ murein hydrolase activator NlpD